MRRITAILILAVLLMNGCAAFPNDVFAGYPAMDAAEMFATEELSMHDTLIIRFMDADPGALNQKQLTVAALITFDEEMMNGGLCQFFVNDHYGYAQYVSDALEEVGATELQAHYDGFLGENKIDVTQMDSFRIANILDYAKQYSRFPYEAFDDTFAEIYQREHLANKVLSYVQLHEDEVLN